MPLPAGGPNFQAYSALGRMLRRTYVHSTVAGIATAAYAELAKERPSTLYVYGETSWPGGGRIRPHRTHQNGTSVDFMVPVRDAQGKSVPLPANPLNEFGYGLELDADGHSGELSIDFDAIAAHLRALDREARERGAGLRRVILAPEYQARVSVGAEIPFMHGKP